MKLLLDVYERSSRATNDSEFDEIVWNALDTAFAAPLPGAKGLIVIVDGIDEASCGEAELMKRLSKATSRGADVRLITLGAEKSHAPTSRHHIRITEDLIFDDIVKVTRSHLNYSSVFCSLVDLEQETLATRIATASKGSFLWASLAAKHVAHEKTKDELSAAVDMMVKSKSTIHEFVLRTVRSSHIGEMTKLMLLWIATAERPLSLKELSTLASIQTNHNKIINQHFDARAILEPVNSLVFLQDGAAYLRHGLIRTAVLEVFRKGKLSFSVKDCETDLVTRLLMYIKMSVNQQHEPLLAVLDSQETSQLLNKHPLLDFAIRYWPIHFRKTPAFRSEGDACAPRLLGDCFPTSTTALLLQNALWQRHPIPTQIAWHATVTKVCRQLWTTKSVVTLQSMISLGLLYRCVDMADEATPLLYDATIAANNMLTNHHAVTRQLAIAYLDVTTPRVANVKNDLMVKREEALRILVDCDKAQYGNESDNVATALKMLLDHYRSIKDEPKAQQIIKSMRSIDMHRTFERDSDLNFRPKVAEEKRPVSTGATLQLDTEERDDPIDESGSFDFELSMKKATKYAADPKHPADKRDEFAERTYIEAWQRVAQECRVHPSALWEERKVKLMIEYSQFLNSRKREHDASSVLANFWDEFKHTSMSLTDKTAPLFYDLAKIMKSTGLPYESISSMKICAKFYRANNSTQSPIYREIEQGIDALTKDIMQSAASSQNPMSEYILEEMVMEAAKSVATMDKTAFTATHGLVKLLISQHRWIEATRLTKMVLRGIWPSLFTTQAQDVLPPQNHLHSSLELAGSLSECYHSRRRLNKEEDIRIRVYRCMRSSRDVDDHVRERATSDLMDFYRRTSRQDMIINIRQEILADSTNQFGHDHPRVIKLLWDLAKLTHPRQVSIDYYQRIIRALNKGADTTCAEAFEPVLIVADDMWAKGLFPDALPCYKVLFDTFLKKPDTSPKLQDPVFMKGLFDRCIDCLRNLRSEFTIIHRVATEYQSQCKAVFGPRSSISIQATMTLAMFCLDSERYEPEAISLFEELLAINSKEIDRDEISSILDSICQSHVHTVYSPDSDSARVERTVKMLQKRLSMLRQANGWAHVESLTKLTELVKYHEKNRQTDMLLKELQEATLNVLATETSSTRLISAAHTIATNYINTSQVGKALDLVDSIYRQIIMKEKPHASLKTKINLTSRGRESLVFLAHLDHRLSHDPTPVTEIMGTMMVQYVYFDQFRSLMNHKKHKFHDVCEVASRLHHSLVISQRRAITTRMMDELVEYFIETEGKRVQLSDRSQINILLETLLQHLSTHKSKNLVRSIGISSNERVMQLLRVQKYEAARELALACYAYISSDHKYRTPEIAKLVLLMGMNLGERGNGPHQNENTRKKMLLASGTILQGVLQTLSEMSINIEQVSLQYLNNLVGLLGEQKDYKTLSWLLTILWNSREAQHTWGPSTTFALARRYIMARYLVGDTSSALSLAEDIVYNYRRVYGSRHPNTLDMTILLTQLYTGIAQRYQKLSAGQAMANRYYKMSAGYHESVLRAFSDPSYAELECGLDEHRAASAAPVSPHASYAGVLVGMDGTAEQFHDAPATTEAERVCEHMKYLRLALQRLGTWAKDYSEYEALNADLYRTFGGDLCENANMEKWDLSSFGAGKAESNEDILEPEFDDWELVC